MKHDIVSFIYGLKKMFFLFVFTFDFSILCVFFIASVIRYRFHSFFAFSLSIESISLRLHSGSFYQMVRVLHRSWNAGSFRDISRKKIKKSKERAKDVYLCIF